MKIKELTTKTLEELRQMLVEEKKKLYALQFKAASKQLKDVRSIRKTKQAIAQVKTLIRKSGPKQ